MATTSENVKSSPRADTASSLNRSSSLSVEKTREFIRRATDAIPTSKPVPSRERHLLNPIEKFRRYGRFPCKLALNVVSFALLCAFIVGCDALIAKDEESQRQSLIRMFMPVGYLDPRVDYVEYPTKHFGRVDNFRSFLAQTVETYYGLTSSATAEYEYWSRQPLKTTRNASATDVLPLSMTAVVRRTSGRLTPAAQAHVTRIVPMTLDSPYGIFGELSASATDRLPNQYNFGWACSPRAEAFEWEPQQARFYSPCRSKAIDNTIFDVVTSVDVSIAFRSISPRDAVTLTPTEYHWELTQRFDFGTNGLIILTLDAHSTMQRHADTCTPWMWVLVSIALFSLWDLVLRARAYRKIRKMKRLAQEQAKVRGVSPAESTTSDDDSENRLHGARFNKWRMDLRKSMGKSWTLWATVTDALAFIYSVEKLFGTFAYGETTSLRYLFSCIGGLALFGSSVLFISYMRFFPAVYALMFSTNVAAPHLLRFLVAVLPIFTAFAFFANVVFGSYAPEFSTFWESCVALYAAIFGDSLLQMFQVTGYATTIPELYQIGFLFSACFVSFFIWAVLNIGTAIVLGAYTYVNESFNLYTFNIDRRVAERKTRREQLDEALDHAEHALRTVATLLEDDRVKYSVSVPKQDQPCVAAQIGAADGKSTSSSDTCSCSTDGAGGRCKRRRRQPSRGPEFRALPWVDHNVIF